MHLLIKDKKLDQADKIQLGISYFLQLTLVGAILFAIYQQNWLNVFAISGIFIFTLLPTIMRRNYRVRLPIEIDFVIILFSYAALFLGEIHSYYTLVWWWDILLHGSSGILLGIAGFLLVYILNKEEQVHCNMKPVFVALFSFVFAIAIGVAWEIFEFVMDTSFGLNMQKSGLVDTMTDLIINVVGASLVSLLGFIYLKSKTFSMDKMIHRFFKHPPLLRRKLK
ncbi:MAG: hypothetical protein Q8R37_00160 [Nanoarchaeota archaeon]|nr:hypothetical protein [Nanoarchaeota archaeon]